MKSGKITIKNLEDRLEAQGYRCSVTGLDLTPQTASLDHIIPHSEGGTNTMDNVQIVHREVNRIKGSLSMQELFEWCIRILGVIK